MEILKAIRRRKYEGSGLLLLRRGPDDTWQMLLGLRRHRPNKGCWSVPGGGRHQAESFWHCACRETSEELGLGREMRMCLVALDRLQVNRSFRTRIRLPFFEFVIYLVPLDKSVASDLPSYPAEEFDKIGWFGLDQPPEPLHWGVRLALLRARSSQRHGELGQF